jgi:hypothetical protein
MLNIDTSRTSITKVENTDKPIDKQPLQARYLSKHQFEERVQQLLKEHKSRPTKGIYY